MLKKDWTDAEVEDIYFDRYGRYGDDYFDEERPGEVEPSYGWAESPDYPKEGERDWEW